MLKRKIDKAAFDAFTGDKEWMKHAYKEDGKGGYVLNAEPDEDVGQLQRAKEFAAEERDQARTALQTEKDAHKATQTAFDTFKSENAGKPKDQSAQDVKDSYERRIADDKIKHDAEIKTANDRAISYAKDTIANRIASSIAVDEGAAELLAPRIAARLDIDLTGDNLREFVLDAQGKRSSITLDELQKDFVDNSKFKSLIKASDASGGGAGSNGGPSGGGAPKALKDMTEGERTAFHKSNPAEFAKQSAALQEAQAAAQYN